MPVPGYGYLTVLDALCDISYQLFEPLVNTTAASFTPVGGGVYEIAVASIASIYVGAQLVAGFGASDVEAATVLSVSGNTFRVSLNNLHSAGEKVFGPTFPVQQPTNPLWSQDEALAYLSTACNDFLKEVPLAYQVNDTVTIAPTQQSGPLPADCMTPERIAFQMPAGPYPLRETSQANLDGYDYRWQVAAAGTPRAYFRDKLPTQYFGIWPRVNNTAEFEVVYQQRQSSSLGLLDGFLFPDIFLPTVKYRALSFAYSKDGEGRNPGLAKYFAARYAFGAKVARVVLESLHDPNLEMAQ